MSEMPNPILEEDEEEQEKEQRFKITTDQMADWAVRKIQQAEDKYQEWVDFYTARIEAAKREMLDTKERMTAMLAEYFLTVPTKETKTQWNYPLPGGKLVMSKDKETIEHDDDALLAWAKENQMTELINVKESIRWADVKDRITAADGAYYDGATGLEIPGITIKTTPGTFKVELKK